MRNESRNVKGNDSNDLCDLNFLFKELYCLRS